jgi:hypothetical protein
MAHGYCTRCLATVTVRGGSCLLGHPVDPSTVSAGRGRHARDGQADQPSTGRSLPSTTSAPAARRQSQPATTRQLATGSVLEASHALVDRLWAETEEHSLTELGWAPTDGDLKRLDKRARWHRLLIIPVVALLVAGGWYGYRYLAEQQQAEAAAEFATALDQLALASEALGSSTAAVFTAGGDRAVLVADLGDFEAASRRLLLAAGGLDAGDFGNERARASELAGTASSIEDAVAAVDAYRALLESALRPPDLPVRADAIEAGGLAAELAAWLGMVDEALAQAPQHELVSSHRSLLTELRPELDDLVARYLAAVRQGDRAGAAAAISRMEQVFRDLRDELTVTAAEAEVWTSTALAQLRAGMEGLSAPR